MGKIHGSMLNSSAVRVLKDKISTQVKNKNTKVAKHFIIAGISMITYIICAFMMSAVIVNPYYPAVYFWLMMFAIMSRVIITHSFLDIAIKIINRAS